MGENWNKRLIPRRSTWLRFNPGIALAEIKAAVPWHLKITGNLTRTSPPSDMDIEILRNFAPDITMGKAMAMETIVNRVLCMMEKTAN